jgi:hypothetical protein
VDSDIVITFADIPAGAVAKATFTDGTYAPAVVDAELNTVTISPAQLTPNAAKTFTLDIIKSTAEPYVLYRNPAGSGVVVGPLWINNGILFTPATSELTLVSTNLYIDRDDIQQAASASAPIFAGSAIEFTFDALPTGAVITADLNGGAIPVTFVQTGNTVTITPIQLKRNTPYTLGLKILSSGSQRTLYEPPVSAATGPIVTNASRKVQFTTADIESLADLLSTNLYINPVTQVDTTPAADLNFFAVDDDIVLTFGSPVPTGAVIDVQLRDARYNLVRTTNTASAADRTLTINPDEDLKPSATYYLWVRMMDTTDAQYWTVTGGLTVVAVDDYFGDTKLQPQTDNNYYIGFSTQKDQVARLVSTNLYLDGNPAYYDDIDDGPYFKLNEPIVLTFADVPDGTRISKAVLNLEANKNNTTGISVYPTLTTDTTTKVTTVTITPNVKLAADETYHLQLALSKTIGADPVWAVTAANGVDGIHGPVYVDHETTMSTIAFKTVSAFRVVPRSSSSLTNIALDGSVPASPSGDFDATNDIVIEFDRPIDDSSTATIKALLRYYRTVSGENNYYGEITNYTLSPDKTVLTIAPTNLLAPDATFVIRLDVTSVDGQHIVYDSTNTGDPSGWANQAYNRDLRIRTEDDVRLTGSKTAATGGSMTIPNTALNKTDIAITTVVFAPPAINFQQDYEIYVRRFGLWDASTTAAVRVNQGETEPNSGNPLTFVIPPLTAFDHFNDEQITYKARGINNSGYVVEVTANRNLTFAP